MIKKIVLLLIMVMMLSQFVACGSNTKQIEQKENMKQSEEQTQERTNENIQEEKELEADKSYPHIFNATKLKCCNNKNDLDKFFIGRLKKERAFYLHMILAIINLKKKI